MVILPAVWIWLTLKIWKFWRRVRKDSGGEWDFRSIAFTVGAILWLFASFWYGGGQKYYYDAWVKRMCARDGGIKVYETVTLPADRFNKWGQVNFFKPTQHENALGPEYIYKHETIYLRKGNPTIRKCYSQIFRKSDMKLLGEETSYDRGGGDFIIEVLPGSVFRCPTAVGSIELMTKIFTKEKEDDDDHN